MAWLPECAPVSVIKKQSAACKAGSQFHSLGWIASETPCSKVPVCVRAPGPVGSQSPWQREQRSKTLPGCRES